MYSNLSNLSVVFKFMYTVLWSQVVNAYLLNFNFFLFVEKKIPEPAKRSKAKRWILTLTNKGNYIGRVKIKETNAMKIKENSLPTPTLLNKNPMEKIKIKEKHSKQHHSSFQKSSSNSAGNH